MCVCNYSTVCKLFSKALIRPKKCLHSGKTCTDICHCIHIHSRFRYASVSTLLPTVWLWAAAHNLTYEKSFSSAAVLIVTMTMQAVRGGGGVKSANLVMGPSSPLQALLSRAATLLGHEGCILLFWLNRVRGTSSSSTEHCQLLSECLFCNCAWSKKKNQKQ